MDKRRKVKAPPTPEKKALAEKAEEGVKEGDQGEAGEDVSKKMQVDGEEEDDKKAEPEVRLRNRDQSGVGSASILLAVPLPCSKG
jgi:hypothetical protein